jgi:predicted outer membrane repeat protein
MATKSGYGNWLLIKSRKLELSSAIALLLLPGAAWADGVVTNCTEADLRAAMAGGGRVTFACDGFIVLTNTVSISLDTVLDASGHQVGIGGANVRAFHVNANVRFTVVNLGISRAAPQGGSGIWNDGGTVNLLGVRFTGNIAPYGGAIYSSGAGAIVAATNCYFEGNTATTSGIFPHGGRTADGGAISCDGQVDLQSCTFLHNSAVGVSGDLSSGISGDRAIGGAISSGGTLTMDLCTFTGNSATGGNAVGSLPVSAHIPGGWGGEGSGGAIWSSSLATLIVSRSTFCGNTATGGNGGPGGNGDSPLQGTPGDGYPGGGGGDAYGGAIYSPGSSLWLACSTLVSNVAIAGNGGNGGGGGVDSHQDFSGNGAPAGNGGSGVGGMHGGSGGLVNCTFAFNTGSGGAGGNGGGSAWVIVIGGKGGAGGNGGMGVGGVAGTGLTNCTVSSNRGTGGTGGAGGYSGGSPGHPGVPGANGTNGPSWGGTSSSALPNTLIASNTPAGGDTFTDPELGPLADNGGPTLTMALLPGSPAIDAGDTSLAPATDQRTFPRPAGSAADIGAFEYGSVMPTISISRADATGLNILATGNTGRWCRLLYSTDLTSWAPIATNQIGGEGTASFYDTYSSGPAGRFYRLVMP